MTMVSERVSMAMHVINLVGVTVLLGWAFSLGAVRNEIASGFRVNENFHRATELTLEANRDTLIATADRLTRVEARLPDQFPPSDFARRFLELERRYNEHEVTVRDHVADISENRRRIEMLEKEMAELHPKQKQPR